MIEARPAPVAPVESLVRALEARRALLVIDNCEHVLDDAAVLTAELLGRCRDLRVVTTSRVPLQLDSESILALWSAPTPQSPRQSRMANPVA